MLSVWTVYRQPLGHYLARRFEVMPSSAKPQATDDFISAHDLELVRDALRLRGLTCLGPGDDDLPHIVESWI